MDLKTIKTTKAIARVPPIDPAMTAIFQVSSPSVYYEVDVKFVEFEELEDPKSRQGANIPHRSG